MTTDIELLPLYAELQGHPKLEIIKHYARANMEPLIAEIEALRAEVERWKSLHDTAYDAFRTGVATERRLEARAERLAEALHKLEEACDDSDGAQYGTLGTAFVRGICKDALLRDHDQEGKDG